PAGRDADGLRTGQGRLHRPAARARPGSGGGRGETGGRVEEAADLPLAGCEAQGRLGRGLLTRHWFPQGPAFAEQQLNLLVVAWAAAAPSPPCRASHNGRAALFGLVLERTLLDEEAGEDQRRSSARQSQQARQIPDLTASPRCRSGPGNVSTFKP